MSAGALDQRIADLRWTGVERLHELAGEVLLRCEHPPHDASIGALVRVAPEERGVTAGNAVTGEVKFSDRW